MIRSRETERDEDIWSAIQYLDPDLDNESNRAVSVTAISVVVLVFMIWILLQLRKL